jgi:GTP cyclohydrolase IB
MTNTNFDNNPIKDIQSMHDDRNMPIDRVGVKNVKTPIIVLDKVRERQHTVADISMYVNLPHHFRGTHMSRFIEIINEYRNTLIKPSKMEAIMINMKEHLDAEEAHLEIAFPYFIEKEAPVSKQRSMMVYRCKFIGQQSEGHDFTLEIEVPVKTLCPCSKEISAYGAHNQRSLVTLRTRLEGLIWIEDLVRLVESSASSELFTLLKREDEKYITEHAYDNPRFVEDVVREIAIKLMEIPEIAWFSVESDNEESIHNHNAYAIIERQVR